MVLIKTTLVICVLDLFGCGHSLIDTGGKCLTARSPGGAGSPTRVFLIIRIPSCYLYSD
jgi:hypothetical protein